MSSARLDLLAVLCRGQPFLISNLLTSAATADRGPSLTNSLLDQVKRGQCDKVRARANRSPRRRHESHHGSRARARQFSTQRPAFATDGHGDAAHRPQGVLKPRIRTLRPPIGRTRCSALYGRYCSDRIPLLSRRAAAGGRRRNLGSFGRAGPVYDAEKPVGSFADVAGIDEVEGGPAGSRRLLREPQEVPGLGGTVPKGVLLIGAPGTGKTLLRAPSPGEGESPLLQHGPPKSRSDRRCWRVPVSATVQQGTRRLGHLFTTSWTPSVAARRRAASRGKR